MDNIIFTASEAPKKELGLACEFIFLHLHEPSLTMHSIAEVASISQKKLEGMFREWKGCSIVQFLLAARLEKAASMLRETEEPVHVISYLCGFDDLHIWIEPLRSDMAAPLCSGEKIQLFDEKVLSFG